MKRPIPDYETLELADPGDALSVEHVNRFGGKTRYLYVLLHALGLRKLAFLLLGTRPLDEEEEALRDVAVIDVPLLRKEYRPWVRHRSVRVVLLEAVPGPEPLGRFDRGGEAEGPAGSRRALNGREESGVERCDSAVVA